MSQLSRSIGLVLAILLTACFGLVAGPMSADALEKSKLALGTAKDPNLGSQIIIAREKGFFKEEGLDVSVKFFPSGGDLLAAIVSGDVAYGSSGSTPISALRGRPYPIKILAQISDISGAQQLIVKSSIKTPADLIGKKVALLKGTASELLFDSFAKAYGFDKSKVKIIAMGPTEMVASFIGGHVDAVNLWEPHTTRVRKAGNGHILVSGTRSYIPGKEGPKRIYGDHAALFAREDVIAANPETTKAILRAIAKATDFIAANSDAAASILAKKFSLSKEDMKHIMSVNNYTMILDKTLVRDLDRLAKFLYSLGKVKTQLRAMDWINPAPLKAVRAEWVKLN